MKNYKRIISISLLFIFVFSAFPVFHAEAAYKISFDLYSDAAYLVNTDTSTVIFEKNADKKIYPASITKVMTAIVCLEEMQAKAAQEGVSLEEILSSTNVTAPRYVYDEFVGVNPSTADIRQGETLRMIDLLYALLLPSACEAANIIADYLGDGSIPEFVDKMNRKAAELGAVNTHYENAHGLFDANQVTSAKDTYLITKYAVDTFPIFVTISSTSTYQMPITPQHPNNNWFILHTNKMMRKGSIYYYPYVQGIKTGSIDEVGKNLVSTASKDGYNYMLVTLAAPAVNENGQAYSENHAFTDAKNLYEWAFSTFSLQKVMKEQDIVSEVKVNLASEQDFVTLVAKEDIIVLLPKDTDSSAIQQNKLLLKNVEAPVKKGETLGKVELRLADDVIATVDLVALTDIERSALLYTVDVIKKYFSQPLSVVLLILLCFLFLLYLLFTLRSRKIRRMKEARMRRRKR